MPMSQGQTAPLSIRLGEERLARVDARAHVLASRQLALTSPKAGAENTTYVLILAPARTGNWPAVIGGYPTREQAEAAGREAVMAHLTQEGFEADSWGSNNSQTWGPWRDRPWTDYTVIPGVASC